MKIRLVKDPDGAWAAASPSKRVAGVVLSVLIALPMIGLLILLAYLLIRLV